MKYHKFWPGLYQACFAKFPEPKPKPDDLKESDVEDDPDPDTHSGTDSNNDTSAGLKSKRANRKAREGKLAKRVSSFL